MNGSTLSAVRPARVASALPARQVRAGTWLWMVVSCGLGVDATTSAEPRFPAVRRGAHDGYVAARDIPL
jgi:hypothetical protein